MPAVHPHSHRQTGCRGASAHPARWSPQHAVPVCLHAALLNCMLSCPLASPPAQCAPLCVARPQLIAVEPKESPAIPCFPTCNFSCPSHCAGDCCGAQGVARHQWRQPRWVVSARLPGWLLPVLCLLDGWVGCEHSAACPAGYTRRIKGRQCPHSHYCLRNLIGACRVRANASLGSNDPNQNALWHLPLQAPTRSRALERALCPRTWMCRCWMAWCRWVGS